jgi:hypothetical protein
MKFLIQRLNNIMSRAEQNCMASKGSKNLTPWVRSLLTGSPVFSDFQKVKIWVLGLALLLAVFAWVNAIKVFDLNIGYFIAGTALFVILFVTSTMRKTQPGHACWITGMALIAIMLSAYLIVSPRLDFETEKKMTGLSMIILIMITAGFKIKKILSPFIALGRGRFWMLLHIYSGLAALLFLMFHVNFKLPIGLLSNGLYYLFVFSIFMGLVGIFLQKVIPIRLGDLNVEAVYEKIPDIVKEMRDQLKTSLVLVPENRHFSKILVGFCEHEIFPFFEKTEPRFLYFFSITAGLSEKLHKFDKVALFLNDTERKILLKIQDTYIEKQQLDVHRSLQWVLRQWLWVHIILSSLLIVLITYHVILIILY